MHIKFITSGADGDIRPAIALGLGLQKAGHKVSIISTSVYENIIIESGLDCIAIIDEDLGNSFLRDPLPQDLLDKLWNVFKDADAVICSHLWFLCCYIAEALEIPCYIFGVIPFSPTNVFPFASVSTKASLGSILNWITYYSFDIRLWKLLQKSINQWREEVLKLPRLSYWAGIIRWIHQKQIPCLYTYSPAFLPKPSNWADWVHVTGYWFLDDSSYQPPKELVEFIETGSPPVYIGFGNRGEFHENWESWDKNWTPEKLTNMVIDAVAKSGQRAILLEGDDLTAKIQLPKEVFTIEWASFDWLFPRMKAVVHHGGLGTTHAALKAGVPSVVVPCDEENYFWANRLTERGLSPLIEQKQLSAEKLAEAIKFVVANEDIHRKVTEVSRQIQAENGVGQAVKVFHQHLQNL
jgi:sterol 3beta-glucosyltransferase